MGRKPILLPFEKSDTYFEPDNWAVLKSRFSGKMLFNANLYNLITGNLSILDKTENQWFYEEILNYSKRTHDINFLPVLKKIAAGRRYGESLQQKATELIEIIEGNSGVRSESIRSSAFENEDSRAETARSILAGVRYPQTTEILRLIRDKSPGLKQLALCLIGKFKVVEMTREVCECLNIQGLESDAFSVLTELGKDGSKEIQQFYLTSSGNLNISKTILRLYSHLCPGEEMSFLTERLASNSRPIKEMVLRALIHCEYKPVEEEKGLLKKLISDTFSTLSWLIASRICLSDHDDKLLLSQIGKEYLRWETFLINLLVLTFGNPITPSSGVKKVEDDTARAIYDLTAIIFDGSEKNDRMDSGTAADRKKLKKLQRYFPFTVPQHQTLLEDLINCDYNLINVWTKACAIRSVRELKDEPVKESLAAVLFSPEWILKEEAGRLIAGEESDLYHHIAHRLPDNDKIRLKEITERGYERNNLIYEKVKFLSSCFPEINEEELLFPAERLKYLKSIDAVRLQEHSNSIIWSVDRAGNILQATVIYDDAGPGDIPDLSGAGAAFFYVLQLDTVELFRSHYPESSFRIFKYIDGIEDKKI